MVEHPKNRRAPMSRREFLARAGMAGVAVPSLAAILAACADTAAGAAPTGERRCSSRAPTAP